MANESADAIIAELASLKAAAENAADNLAKMREERDAWHAQARRLAESKEKMQAELVRLTSECADSRKRERKLVDAVVRLSELVCGGCSRNGGY